MRTRVAPYAAPTLVGGERDDERPTVQRSGRAHALEAATVREIMPLGARVGAAQIETLAGTPEPSTSAPREMWGCPLCGATYPREEEICPVDGEPLLTLSWTETEADALVGAVIQGRYEVESVLGRGGMGTVYQVRHKALGKRFALKVLRREVAIDADSVQRFVQEAQIAASVKHTNLADVSDCGEISGADVPALGAAHLPFFVMEMLKGESLGERLRDRGSIDAGLAAEILRQCSRGLAAAHAAGVIHRDLKPDNIFLSEVEGQLVCKILDFGVAKILSKAKLTKAGTVFGTPCYMAPEQASGGTLDGRTDLYALGVVLYEALSGRVPFSAETHMGVLTKHVFEVPEPIELVVQDPSKLGALGPIIMRCLEKDPDARFADATELERTVDEAAAAGYVLPRERPKPALRLREPLPETPPARAPAPRARRRWLWALLPASIALASLALYGALRATSRGTTASDAASATSTELSSRASPAEPGGASASASSAEGPSATAAPSGAPTAAVGASASTAETSARPSPSSVATKPPGARPGGAEPGVARPAGTHRPSEVVDTW